MPESVPPPSERDAPASAQLPADVPAGLRTGRSERDAPASARGMGVPPADDLLDPGVPCDPAQWVMHGLLTIYFDPARDDPDTRVQELVRAVLGRARVPGRRGWLVRLVHPRLWVGPGRVRTLFGRTITRRQVLGGGLAAAAVILLAVLLTLSPPTRQRLTGGRTFELPDFAARCEAAVLAPTPLTSFGTALMLCGLDLGNEKPESAKDAGGLDARRAGRPLLALLHSVNCGEIDVQLAAIEASRTKRAQYLAEMALGCESTEIEGQSLHDALMFTWADDIFRPLRDLGRFEEALDEIRRAVDFASGGGPTGEVWQAWHSATLNELAITLEAMGDYDGARAAHLDSIAARLSDDGDPAVDDGGWRATIPFVSPYLSLSWLAVLRDGRAGLSDAWKWQRKAETVLQQYFAAICASYNISVPSTASAFEVFRRLPEEFQTPPEEGYGDQAPEVARHCGGWLPAAGLVAWLRAELYSEVRLRRFAGDYAGAAATLDQIATLPNYRFVDEWRLDYWVPVEAARVAILRGDDRGALAQLEVARNSAGATARPFEWLCSERAVGPLALVDVELLRGVALLGAQPDSSGGRQTIRDALAVLDRLADDVPAAQRAAFKSRFRVWDELVVAAR